MQTTERANMVKATRGAGQDFGGGYSGGEPVGINQKIGEHA